MTLPLTNGGFDFNLDGWVPNGATIQWESPGYAHVTAGSAGNGIRQTLPDLEAGQQIFVRYTIPSNTGSFSSWLSVNSQQAYGTVHDAPGTYEDVLTAPSTGAAFLAFISRLGAAEFRIDEAWSKQAMALASVGYNLTVILVDSGGNQANLRYELTAADATTAATDAAAIVAALNLVTNAVIKGYTLGHRYEENAFSYPAGGIHVEDRATVVVGLTTSPSKRATINIPAPVDGLFLSATGDGYNRVDPADADLQSYVAIYGTGNEATISDGENVDTALANGGIVEGRRTHRQASYG